MLSTSLAGSASKEFYRPLGCDDAAPRLEARSEALHQAAWRCRVSELALNGTTITHLPIKLVSVTVRLEAFDSITHIRRGPQEWPGSRCR